MDTVYLVAYLKPSEPLHDEAVGVLESLGPNRKISQAALIELDLLMKSRGFTLDERLKTWKFLEKLIPAETVELIIPQDFTIAAVLTEKYGLDYFDGLVAAQCMVRNAKPLTTDKDIINVVSKVTISDIN